MKIVKKLLSLSLPLFKIKNSLSLLFSNTPSLTILTFHDIPDYKVDEFDKFISGIQSSFNFITPEECENALLNHGPLPKNAIFITFDDGFKSAYNAWEKVLKPKNIKGAYFICPSFIGLNKNVEEYVSNNLFMGAIKPSDVKKYQYPMNKEEILNLQKNGNLIGSHTTSHQNLVSLISDKQRVEQIVDSKVSLSKLIAKEVNWIAYPFGAIENIDKESLDLISKNYSLCFSNVRGTNYLPNNPLSIRRQNIDIHSPLKDQLYIVWKGLDIFYGKKRKMLDSFVENA